ncbi:MAG TPA: chemotaxis protein CheX [Verrucomicrobiota bacterium]|nr:chemotaxis protein CheX [Verrucomicrobiota bacterium]
MRPEYLLPDLTQIGGRALVEVIDTLLALPIEEVLQQNEPNSNEAAIAILATVKLTGERLSGDVRLQIPETFAGQAVSRLLGGRNSPNDTEVDDFAGELCNMIAGRVAGQLSEDGYRCVLETPSVIRGSRFLLEPETGAGFGRTEWSCQGHSLTLHVQCHYRPT